MSTSPWTATASCSALRTNQTLKRMLLTSMLPFCKRQHDTSLESTRAAWLHTPPRGRAQSCRTYSIPPVPVCRVEEGLADDFGVRACPQNVQLKWMAEATSSIYATPIITDLFADGFKDIIVGSFVHYLEAFQGEDGSQNTGFPAYHASKVHTSPLMFDVNQDGIQDIMLATYDGEILFYKDTGELLALLGTGSKLVVPRLQVKRCVICCTHSLGVGIEDWNAMSTPLLWLSLSMVIARGIKGQATRMGHRA